MVLHCFAHLLYIVFCIYFKKGDNFVKASLLLEMIINLGHFGSKTRVFLEVQIVSSSSLLNERFWVWVERDLVVMLSFNSSLWYGPHPPWSPTRGHLMRTATQPRYGWGTDLGAKATITVYSSPLPQGEENWISA